MLADHAQRNLTDRGPGPRRHDEVGHLTLAIGLRAATGRHERVHARECLHVVCKLIFEQAQQYLTGALKRVGALLTSQLRWSRLQRVERDHHNALSAERERGLDRSVQTRAPVEIPAP